MGDLNYYQKGGIRDFLLKNEYSHFSNFFFSPNATFISFKNLLEYKTFWVYPGFLSKGKVRIYAF